MPHVKDDQAEPAQFPKIAIAQALGNRPLVADSLANCLTDSGFSLHQKTGVLRDKVGTSNDRFFIGSWGKCPESKGLAQVAASESTTLARALFRHSNERSCAMTSVKRNGEVEFRFFRAGAKQVCLAGDFTGWQQQAIPMREMENGWWVARVQLDPGEYRFRYVADGQWFTDFASHGVELKKQTWNSVLLVPGVAQEQQTELRIAA